MSVSFTDQDEAAMREKGYEVEQSELGNVYYPGQGIAVPKQITINYIEHPWVTCFEVEGIKITNAPIMLDTFSDA